MGGGEGGEGGGYYDIQIYKSCKKKNYQTHFIAFSHLLYCFSFNFHFFVCCFCIHSICWPHSQSSTLLEMPKLQLIQILQEW